MNKNFLEKFGSHSQFKLLTDGTIVSRNGVQTNCGGIAKIHVRITLNPAKGIAFRVADHDGEHDEGYGIAVPGAAVPLYFREAVFKGAQQAFEESNMDIGVCFELLDAFVHMVDARELRFQVAGWVAMTGWLEWYEQDSGHLAGNEQQEV
jgi:hypothetical protein